MFIVILGPDGSGKTTIADEIVIRMGNKNIKTHHFAMNFEVLPKLRDIINPFLKKKITSTHVEGEYYGGMKSAPSSNIKGLLLVTWYALDYFLGNLRLHRWKQKGDVVIFARYFYDYYFQRGHINTPHWYINMLEIIVPKPDYIFTIIRTPEDIFKLKPELSITEIGRQQNAIDKLLENRKNAYTIDGNSGIEDTLEQVMMILENK